MGIRLLVSEKLAVHANPVLLVVTFFLFQGDPPQGGMMAVAQRQRQAFALAQGMQVKAVTFVARTDGINVRLLSKRASNTFDHCNMKSESTRNAVEGKIQRRCRIVRFSSFSHVVNTRTYVLSWPPPYSPPPHP